MMRRFGVLALAGALLGVGTLAAPRPALGASIVWPVGTPSTGAYSAVYAGQFNLLSWTFTSGFTDVAIEASLTSPASGLTGNAYLMALAGPGSTVADELASTAFTFAQAGYGVVSYVPLFSGLTLGPGTYYLVLSASNETSNAGITVGPGVTYTTAAGVAVGTPQFSTSEALYPPATAWSDSGFRNRFFTVTGEAVPEPASLLLLGTGLVGLVAARRKRN
jgi:hypothetical protein